MKRRYFVIVSVILMVALGALEGCRTRRLPREEVPKLTTNISYSSGDYMESITVDGRTRTFLLHIPKGYSDSKEYPLVMLFHGGGGSGTKVGNQTDFDEKADKEGFILVAPDGVKHNWNDGRGTTDAEKLGVEDIKFLRALVNNLQGKLLIDSNKIYATGVSNGGIFSHRLACDMADVFAATGPAIGSIPSNYISKCSPAKPISIVVIQGTADPFIPIDGGDTKHKTLGIGDGGLVESADNAMKFWASKNGCTKTEKEKLPIIVNDGTSVEKITNTNCKENTEVVYYIVNGMGHGWPPKGGEARERISGPNTGNIDATEIFWEFFKSHPKEQSQPIPSFETKKISSDSSLPQGETEIIADNNGHVIVAWMDGSPANQARFTLRTAYSLDNGRTFAQDQKINANLILGDPSLDMDGKGNAYLSALRKDTRLTWKDLAVVLFNSDDFGKSWQLQSIINDEGIFNDRDWLAIDSKNNLHIVYSPRISLSDGNFDRVIYYQRSEDSGKTFLPKVLVTSNRLPNDSGASSRGIVVTKDGRIAVGVKEVPKGGSRGVGTSRGMGYVYISKDDGKSFGIPIPFTTKETRVGAATIEEGEESPSPAANPLKPFPPIKTFEDAVYALWVGESGNDNNSLYLASFISGSNSFTYPVAVVKGPADSLTLPALAIDKSGNLHLFWLQKVLSEHWSLFYSYSNDNGRTFSKAQQVAPVTFLIEQWPGDFISATANDKNLFAAWAVAGGPQKGIYVSILRNI